MKYAKLTQQQLADAAGMKQPSLSYLLNDEGVTGSEFTVRLAKACKVRPEWLDMEDGEMTFGYNVDDPRIKAVAIAMENMKDTYKKDIVVATSNTLLKSEEKNNGTQ